MIAEWLAARRHDLAGTVTPITLSDSREWRLEDGVLRHRTGGFFSITGRVIAAPGLIWDGQAMAMIDQPEIGLLGIVTAPGADGDDWLLQAKSEPGSVGWVQAGPTVQATRSNYLRRHGGTETRFLELFRETPGGAITGLAQSEQGTRFINKFNTNAVVHRRQADLEAAADWRWFPAEALRLGLAADFCINTDARSVIVSHDWRALRRQMPLFTGQTHAAPALAPLRAALAHSWSAPSHDTLTPALTRLDSARSVARMETWMVPVTALPGWSDVGTLPATDRTGGVVFLRVEAPAREVQRWDQPFMTAACAQRCGLVIANRDGVACVGFGLSAEPGFARHVQFGPSFQSDTGMAGPLAEIVRQDRRTPALSLRQSDEGGRFLRVEMQYEVHDLRGFEAALDRTDLVWLPLRDIATLSRISGALTNEARSALSLILSLA